MASPSTLDERWEEIVDAIRGSCEWCASAVRAMHLCELTILHDVGATVVFGVGEESAYQQLPDFLEKPGTVLIQRELLREDLNPGVNFSSKLIGFACVLAHEMAHHALRHDWAAPEFHSDVSSMAVEKRRWVLDILEAAKLASMTGIAYEVVVNHWAITDDRMRETLIDIAADRSDARALRVDDDSRIEHDNLPNESSVHLAEEWVAAVVGCMMRFRLQKGREFALRMTKSVLAELSDAAEAPLILKALSAACQNREAESVSVKLAINTLEGAFHNSDMQECEQSLRSQGRDWASHFVERS